MRRMWRRSDRGWRVGIVALLLGVGMAPSGSGVGARSLSDVESGDVVLRISEPRILSIQDGSRLFLGEGIEDPNGYGRPGGSGLIVISGIGLAGATGIEFDGSGVRGEIVSAGTSAELNPSILVRVTIEPTAELGPRAFTLLTPRGPVRSEGVAFIVTPPRILAVIDGEGAPGSSGRIEVFGIGLDRARAIEFEGSGVSGTIVPSGIGFEFLNPIVEVDLRIAENASLGERSFLVETAHARVRSERVRFRVVTPRIEGIWEGHNFHPDQGFRLSGEGARDSFGHVLVFGIGLGGATEVTFSGSGIEARLMPGFPEQQRELNPVLTVHVRIAPDAPLGGRTIRVTIPRAPGRVESHETGVTFTVVEPRIDGIADRRGFNEAIAGACGEVEVRGVGLREATHITFSVPGGIRGTVRPTTSSAPLLNEPLRVWLAIDADAVIGPRSFSLRTPRGEVPSEAVVFVVSTPRIVGLSVEETLPLFLASRERLTVSKRFPLALASGERASLRQRFRSLDAASQAVPFFGTGSSLGNEVAPASAGTAVIFGVGLIRTHAVRFSGTGVTAMVRPMPVEDLNPIVPIHLEIEQTASPGERTFTLTLSPLGSCL
ncbi:MAG: hypothetical protein N0A16_04640 [Blastocatellia bacterium]|nr:hypothetical protein [Blastocatellia bacterium]MCS7156999.1 hypothetical protein [Blastocatellia bacterium]MDW8167692.1 hypothetical protein [Acidobacteriota bacterium]MDW8256291.1 hypothetical protein [Acidobacteriota bacterium]